MLNSFSFFTNIDVGTAGSSIYYPQPQLIESVNLQSQQCAASSVESPQYKYKYVQDLQLKLNQFG